LTDPKKKKNGGLKGISSIAKKSLISKGANWLDEIITEGLTEKTFETLKTSSVLSNRRAPILGRKTGRIT